MGKCADVPREVCQQVAREHCKSVPRQTTTTRIENDCRTVQEQSCRQVPRQACEQSLTKSPTTWMNKYAGKCLRSSAVMKLNPSRLTGRSKNVSRFLFKSVPRNLTDIYQINDFLDLK